MVLIWAFLLMLTKFPKVAEEAESGAARDKGRFKDLFKYPHFVQGVLAQFFYVGAQVGTWSYFIQYVQDYTDQPEKVAGYFLTGTLVAFGVGRFSATYIMEFIQPRYLMGIYSIVNVMLVAVGVLHPGWVGLWAIFLTSFFMSLMFPTIFALGIKELGPNTKLGGSMIIMAIVGGAVFTPIMGLVFDHTRSMALAMLVPLGLLPVHHVLLVRGLEGAGSEGFVDFPFGEAAARATDLMACMRGIAGAHAFLDGLREGRVRSGRLAGFPDQQRDLALDGRPGLKRLLQLRGRAAQELLVQLGDLAGHHGRTGAQDGRHILQGCQDPVRRLIEDERGFLVFEPLQRLAPLAALGGKKAAEMELVGGQAGGGERGQNRATTRAPAPRECPLRRPWPPAGSRGRKPAACLRPKPMPPWSPHEVCRAVLRPAGPRCARDS